MVIHVNQAVHVNLNEKYMNLLKIYEFLQKISVRCTANIE